MHSNDPSNEFFIRWFDESEIDWVNEQYQRVGFKPSQLHTDRIAIAMFNQERVGLGRLCQIEDFAFELGGMYIQPRFLGLGIARRLVRFMLKHCNPEGHVYCLPFAHLRNFYLSEGFKELPEELVQTVSHDVLEKHRWCNETYPHEVLLLHFPNTSESSGSQPWKKGVDDARCDERVDEAAL